MNFLKKTENLLIEGGIDPSEAKAEARLVVEHFSGFSAEEILMGAEFDPECLSKIMETVKRRVETGAPVQYLLGFAHFMGQKYLVNENVLIPRDDTEILVQSVIELLKERGEKKVLDIGTGSGCIACSVALKCQGAQVLGTDISTAALSVAIENMLSLNLINRAVFRKSDIFSNIHDGEKFDIIVSNPPYIPLSTRENLQKEVLFEPSSALFTNDSEGLEFYRRIVQDAPKYLNPFGHILFEVGQHQAQKVREMLLEGGFSDIKIVKDLAGIERVVCAQRLE
ncbi:release factor glutamine methyltransferase [Candidatus Gastranaerophilus sp. (ex Termes propinquus)]|nr:release factor glutamine methyltransferase [Candidatus Gastranaerophilus sp. (ex Termes propinquus)]